LVASGYKSISIKPGGLKGFYALGICKYIKEHYCLDEYHFYGSSAGSWNALYLSMPFSSNHEYYFDKMIKIKKNEFENFYDLERELKQNILKQAEQNESIMSLNYKCNICFSVFEGYKFKKVIKNEFKDLDDLLECCIASSHIPKISKNKLFYHYNNQKCIDGGLFQNNYPNQMKPKLVISHKMFRNKNIYKYSNLKHLNIERLIYEGYRDAMSNNNYLREIFADEIFSDEIFADEPYV